MKIITTVTPLFFTEGKDPNSENPKELNLFLFGNQEAAIAKGQELLGQGFVAITVGRVAE